MENNEIMQRLMQDDKQKSNTKDESLVKQSKGNNEVPMSRIRVVTAKYKVYIVLLVFFICLLLLVSIPNADDSFESSKSKYEQVNNQLVSLENDIKAAKADMAYLCGETGGIIKNESAIRRCLNDENSCTSLPDTWKNGTGEEAKYDLDVPLSYLQLHSLYNKKMPVDEKRVLKNLNEYLVKWDISGSDRRRVGDILRIEIGDPKEVNKGDEHFYNVTIDVQIKFDNVGDLTGFLYNVEKKLIENGEDRILYKIQSVSYDIVTNNEPQITDISMMAYYYHDEKFENKTVAVNAKVDGNKILLEAKGWNGNLGDIRLKQEIRIPENREVEARDLFELPDGVTVVFNDEKGINKTKEGGRQKVTVGILKDAECSNLNKDRNTYEDFESGTDENSFFQTIFKDLKI